MHEAAHPGVILCEYARPTAARLTVGTDIFSDAVGDEIGESGRKGRHIFGVHAGRHEAFGALSHAARTLAIALVRLRYELGTLRYIEVTVWVERATITPRAAKLWIGGVGFMRLVCRAQCVYQCLAVSDKDSGLAHALPKGAEWNSHHRCTQSSNIDWQTNKAHQRMQMEGGVRVFEREQEVVVGAEARDKRVENFE